MIGGIRVAEGRSGMFEQSSGVENIGIGLCGLKAGPWRRSLLSTWHFFVNSVRVMSLTFAPCDPEPRNLPFVGHAPGCEFDAVRAATAAPNFEINRTAILNRPATFAKQIRYGGQLAGAKQLANAALAVGQDWRRCHIAGSTLQVDFHLSS